MLYTEKWAYAPIGEDGQPLLVDISENPLSEDNVADSNPDVARELHGKFVQRLREMDAPKAMIALFEQL